MLHARIVEALEALAGDRLDDQVERLAHHALRGEVWDKALAYGRQAGDKARTRSAYREAVVCFEQALAALEHLPEVVPPPSRPLTSGSAYAPRSMPWEKPLGGCSTTCAAPRPSPRRWAIPCGSGGSTPTWAPISGWQARWTAPSSPASVPWPWPATLGHVGLAGLGASHPGSGL